MKNPEAAAKSLIRIRSLHLSRIPDVDAMDPVAAKGYLEDTAIELLNIVQPSDHETLVRIVGYWNENYGEYEAPAVWDLDALEGDDDDYYKARRHNPLRHMMRAFGQSC